MTILVLSGSIQYGHNSVIIKILITNFSQDTQTRLSVAAHICYTSTEAGGCQTDLHSCLCFFKKATHNSIKHRLTQNKSHALAYPEIPYLARGRLGNTSSLLPVVFYSSSYTHTLQFQEMGKLFSLSEYILFLSKIYLRLGPLWPRLALSSLSRVENSL